MQAANITMYTHDISPRYLPYDKRPHGNATEEVYIWGKTRNGDSAVVIVNDFRPKYYIMLDAADSAFSRKAAAKLKTLSGVFSAKHVERRTLNGGLKVKDNIEVRLCNSSAVGYISRILEKGLYVERGKQVHGKVLETFIEIETKLSEEAGIEHCSMLKAYGHLVREEDKVTTCRYEVIASWKDLEKYDKEYDEVSVRPDFMSWDIEANSENPNQMCNPLRAGDVAYMVSCVFGRYKKPESRQRIGIIIGDCYDIASVGGDGEAKVDSIIRVEDEHELVMTMLRLQKKIDPDIILGYNIFDFDYRFLLTRMERDFHGWPEGGRFIEDEEDIFLRAEDRTLKLPCCSGRILIDMYLIMKEEKRRSYKLEDVGQDYLGRGKHDMPAKEMFAIYSRVQDTKRDLREELHSRGVDTGGSNLLLRFAKSRLGKLKSLPAYQEAIADYTRVMAYCFNDSDLSADLFEKKDVWEGMSSFSKVGSLRVQMSHIKGAQSRSVSILYKTTKPLNFTIDKFGVNANYKGGYVFDPVPGMHKKVTILDFKSLYPSVAIECNLCYTTWIPYEMHGDVSDEDAYTFEYWEDETEEITVADKSGKEKKKKVKKPVKRVEKFWRPHIQQGVVPMLMRNLLDERAKVRRRQKTEKDPVKWLALEKLQLAFKLFANGFYGILAMQNGLISHIYVARTITGCGRNSTLAVSRFARNLCVETTENSDGTLSHDFSNKRNAVAAAILRFKEVQASVAVDERVGALLEKVGMGNLIGEIEVITPQANDMLSEYAAELKGSPPEAAGLQTVYGDTDSIMIKTEDVVKTALQAFALGNKLACYFCEELFGHMPDRLILENERVADFVGLVKKKYYCIEYKPDGTVKYKKNGEYDIYGKGGPTLRRETPLLVCEIYDKVLQMVFTRKSLSETLRYLFESMLKVSEGEYPNSVFEMTGTVGANYKIDSAFMLVFFRRMIAAGKDINPKDRVTYYICEGPGSKGEKMVLKDDLATCGAKIDYRFYIEKNFLNCFNQLIYKCFYKLIEDLDIGYCVSAKKTIRLDEAATLMMTMFWAGEDLEDLFDACDRGSAWAPPAIK